MCAMNYFYALFGFFIYTRINCADLIQQPICKEKQINFKNGVECKGNFSDPEILREKMKEFDGTLSLWMEDVLIDTLPNDTFNVKEESILPVESIIFQNVTLHLLNVPELGAQPFQSIRYHLERFEIYNSIGVFSWDWKILSEMEKLNTIIVENSLMIAVPPSLGSAPNLRFVELRRAQILWLHPQVFSTSTKLTFCSLAHNDIDSMKREMFPLPANKLWSLDFSYNKLEKLPDDMFESMPALKELKLDNNHLANLGKSIERSWEDLTQLWLHSNALNCSLLCWTKKYPNEPLFFSATTCNSDDIDMPFSQYECPEEYPA